MADGKLLRVTDPNRVPSCLHGEPSRDFSIVTLTAGWPEDLERLVAGLATHCSATDYEVVALANVSGEAASAIERLAQAHGDVHGVHFSQRVGYGGGINAGIGQSRGEVVVVADTSIEPVGDFLSPLSRALCDPSVGLLGPWGLLTADMRRFREETTGEVDAMQGYCMAFRRSDLATVGLLDTKYTFYRNADLDYSLRWRDCGFRIRALPLPLRRHAHREWESLTEEQRQRKSRDNFARFLRRWRDRSDLLTGRAGHPED